MLCSANIAYRSFVSWHWGFLGWSVRVVLPICMVFMDYEFQHLVHIWFRVLENLLEDQVQQCITAICSAINNTYRSHIMKN